MSNFKKYMHLERYGNDAVDGIEVGINYVFPKLDGTNAQVWRNEDGTLGFGSRNRVLSLDNDNAGFMNYGHKCPKIESFFAANPDHRLYGEWLVPHSLKTYQEEAWRKFYIFDVESPYGLMEYDQYKPLLDASGLDYLPPIAIIKNGSYEQYQRCLEKNVFLVKDGQGLGEGIVIKNYSFVNKFGDQVWAKMISNSFKEIHHKEMGAPVVGQDLIEEKIVRTFVTPDLIGKVYNKIITEKGGWESKNIPELLNRVFYDLVTEETWDILKAHNYPRIDFKLLKNLTFGEVKRTMSHLF